VIIISYPTFWREGMAVISFHDQKVVLVMRSGITYFASK
jgi:hypothetical protein